MPLYLNFFAIVSSNVWLDRHKLLAFFSFGHVKHLLSWALAQVRRKLIALKLVFCRATHAYNEISYRICQYAFDRIGICPKSTDHSHLTGC